MFRLASWQEGAKSKESKRRAYMATYVQTLYFMRFTMAAAAFVLGNGFIFYWVLPLMASSWWLMFVFDVRARCAFVCYPSARILADRSQLSAAVPPPQAAHRPVQGKSLSVDACSEFLLRRFLDAVPFLPKLSQHPPLVPVHTILSLRFDLAQVQGGAHQTRYQSLAFVPLWWPRKIP